MARRVLNISLSQIDDVSMSPRWVADTNRYNLPQRGRADLSGCGFWENAVKLRRVIGLYGDAPFPK